jgi:hypothetical protein
VLREKLVHKVCRALQEPKAFRAFKASKAFRVSKELRAFKVCKDLEIDTPQPVAPVSQSVMHLRVSPLEQG